MTNPAGATFFRPFFQAGAGRAVPLALLAPTLFVLACGGNPPPPPPPPPPPWECEINLPWCHETDPPMTCGDCVHNPTDNPEHCEKAQDCEEPPLPEPQCDGPAPPACDCYLGQAWIGCSVPTDCPFSTPTATELFARGVRVEIAPRREGRNVSATPQAAFGREYYCQPGLWPEACAGGRSFGPVAPDGHPKRAACERQFLEQNCPTFVMSRCTGTGNWCPITFDPWYVIGGVNQNHPRNVEAGCHGTDWVKDADGHVLQGMFWIASAHGRGYVQACNKGKVVCTESRFEIDN